MRTWKGWGMVGFDGVAGRTRTLGRLMTGSGIGGVLIGALTMAYPPAVTEDVRGYPFPSVVSVVVGVALAAVHLMTAAGFWGVARANPHRSSRLAAVGIWVAAVGFVILTAAELLSSWRADESIGSDFSAVLDNVFGFASVLTAAGSVMAGIVIVRQRVWTGVARWSTLASGTVMILVVIPALITGSLILSMSALMLWSLTFVPIGLAVSRRA